MGTINKEAIPLYIIGCLAATCTGMVYPAFGIVYAHAIQDFQMTGHALRVAGELNVYLQPAGRLICMLFGSRPQCTLALPHRHRLDHLHRCPEFYVQPSRRGLD
jgi:hypothetical protein